MKENVLDVLMYLFENYFYDESDEKPDASDIEHHLADAGFEPAAINMAFDWLDELSQQREDAQNHATKSSIRVYSPEEAAVLSLECRGFLQQLESAGILDSTSRERIVDRCMALGEGEMDLDDLKWVILIVLFNQPGQEAAYAWMENHMFEEAASYTH